MEKIIKLSKRICIILAIGVAIILVGTAGELDHHEYIEVNSTPKTRMPFYYEN